MFGASSATCKVIPLAILSYLWDLVESKMRVYIYIYMNHGIVIHNRHPTKNCENIRTPKTIFKASFGLKNHLDPLSVLLRLLPKYKKPSYMVSIFFMLL